MDGSLGYASRLSHREDLGGQLGAPELSETAQSHASKVKQLAQLVRSAQHLVVFTGAGISTSVGIPDFRGPTGVWTQQRRGKPPPKAAVPFSQARPSLTHQALLGLQARPQKPMTPPLTPPPYPPFPTHVPHMPHSPFRPYATRVFIFSFSSHLSRSLHHSATSVLASSSFSAARTSTASTCARATPGARWLSSTATALLSGAMRAISRLNPP